METKKVILDILNLILYETFKIFLSRHNIILSILAKVSEIKLQRGETRGRKKAI